MILDDFEYQSCGWLAGNGPAADRVVSTRIRLARNLNGVPFTHWASSADLQRINSICADAVLKSDLLADSEEVNLERASEADLRFLQERHLISREMARLQNQASVFIDRAQTISAMVAEEDHLRLQVIHSGFDLSGVWGTIDRLDDDLANRLDYAYSERLGFLTACPSNVGTGLRCSVMLHLPGLVVTQLIQRVVRAVNQLGMTVRGWMGEGSEIRGNLFQISNQVTLGISEDEVIARIESVTSQILESEQKAVSQLMNEIPEEIEDRVERARTVLGAARKMSSTECLEMLSSLRLGITAGVLNEYPIAVLNELLLCTRPAHLQKRAGCAMNTRERDIYRSEYIRKVLGN